MRRRLEKRFSMSIREVVFGLEDGLVSTLGVITGIAAGTNNHFVVILSGFVVIFVEATSMGAGSYLSNKSAQHAEDQLMERKGKRVEVPRQNPIRGGLIMWVFYAIGGAIPLIPYFFLTIRQSYWPSIILTALALFALGAWSARFTGRSKIKSGFEMTVVALAAAGIGFLIGEIVSSYFGVQVLG